MHTLAILEASTKFGNSLDANIQKLSVFYEKLKTETPSVLREQYDIYLNALNAKETDSNKIKNELNDSITSINKCIDKVNKFNEIVGKMKMLVNKARV